MKDWPPDPWQDFRLKLAEIGFEQVRDNTPEEMMLRAISEILRLRERNNRLEYAVSRLIEEM